ncbi:hypothetical protein C8R45DRAFT_501374 [Mycena sanguinolenta]|nr:hypothetical protein C8R45DRAFT_501374 [Mycena sanguinolenta]
MSSLSEDQYYKLCAGYVIAQYQCFQVSTQDLVGPGIFLWDFQYGIWVRITEPLVLPNGEPYWHNYEEVPGELLPNSWMRYHFGRTSTLTLKLHLPSNPLSSSFITQKAWLAQASRIFADLQEQAPVKDYVCVENVQFILRTIDHPSLAAPEGYLFVCPSQDFRTGATNLYQWPACPAYWSLDSSGADRLSTEDARILGFPVIHIETRISGSFWDRSVYDGLRRFHEGKGLDPESQEVARRLGYPLYEVLSDLGSEMPFPARKVDSWPFWCKHNDPALCRELGHYL